MNIIKSYIVTNAAAAGGGSGAGGGVSLSLIADLYAYSTAGLTSSSTITVAGYFTEGDGGGGIFVWMPSLSTADDGGIIIKPTATVGAGRWKRIFNYPIDVRWFGAIANDVRDCTTAIQNALNYTGHIYVPYQSGLKYVISDRLLIYSNTWLECDPLAHIFEAAGTNTVMIRNATINLVGTTTDHDIRLTGGYWDNNWGNNGDTRFSPPTYKTLLSDKTSPTQGIAGVIDFNGVDKLVVEKVTILDATVFSIHISSSTNFEVGHIRFIRVNNTVSDGIHISKPATNFYIHDISGDTGDDVIALGAGEWHIASPGLPTGHITKGVIENIIYGTAKWAIIKAYTCTNNDISDITVNNIKAISTNVGFYWGNQPDSYDAANAVTQGTGGTIKNIVLNNISVGVTSLADGFGQVFYINGAVGNLTLNNVLIDSTYKAVSTKPYFEQVSTSGITNIQINNLSQNEAIADGFVFDFKGAVTNLGLSNCKFLGDGTFSGNKIYPSVRLHTNSAVASVLISNCRYSGTAGAVWQNTSAGATKIQISNSSFLNFNSVVLTAATASINLSNNIFTTNNSAIVNQASATINVSTSTNIWDASGSLLISGGGSVRWNGIDMPINASLINTPTTNDQVKNTNAGAGYVGIAFYNGATWTTSGAVGANPSATIGLSAVNGSALTFLRSDGAPALSQTITPTWTGTHIFSNATAIVNSAFNTTGLNARFGSFGIQSYAVNNGWMSDNLYFDGSVYKYISNGFGILSYFISGAYSITTVPTGLSGNTATTTTRFMVTNVGDVGIGAITTVALAGANAIIKNTGQANFLSAYIGSATTNPTARLHLAAGTTAASTAPLKFTSGTNMTTAETGAIEYNGTNLLFTRTGTTRESIMSANAVNSVSPTTPNRTITVVIDGTTLYIHAKTTND